MCRREIYVLYFLVFVAENWNVFWKLTTYGKITIGSTEKSQQPKEKCCLLSLSSNWNVVNTYPKYRPRQLIKWMLTEKFTTNGCEIKITNSHNRTEAQTHPNRYERYLFVSIDTESVWMLLFNFSNFWWLVLLPFSVRFERQIIIIIFAFFLC